MGFLATFNILEIIAILLFFIGVSISLFGTYVGETYKVFTGWYVFFAGACVMVLSFVL